ncbi:MAG TPA: hypothetical protein VH054_14275 [Polyangiaceae bacterium]|jgi:hypothetical protein|nr:hypothetical protein [Polyangiaceae bacterium]
MSFGKQLVVDSLYVLFAFAASWCLWRVPGIPVTHDGFGLQIVESYRRTYLAHDYFPTWFSFASNGRGSMFPMLYHRLHGQVFGLLAVKLGAELATKLSIPICLLVGAAGMRRLAEAYGVRPRIAWLLGLFLMTTPYAICDWFTRGAVAELMAFMLVPWCLRALVRTLRGQAQGVGLAVSIVLLFFAHMLAFYFFSFFVFAATVDHVLRTRRLGSRAVWKPIGRLARAGALSMVVVGPYVAAVEFVVGLSPITDIAMRSDALAYMKFREYFFDTAARWTYVANNTHQMRVEIGRWVLVALVACVALVPRGARVIGRDLMWMIVPSLAFMLVQPRELSFVFDTFPGASKVQFPMRLLVYVVPTTLLCLGVAAEQAMRRGGLAVRTGVVLAVVTAAAGQFYLAIDVQRFMRLRSYTDLEVDESIASADPMKTKLEEYPGWQFFTPGFRRAPEEAIPLVDAGNCLVSSKALLGVARASTIWSWAPFKSLELTTHGQGCRVVIAQYQTPLLDVTLSRHGHVSETSDGTIVVDAPDDETIVRLRRRTIFELGARWLKQVFHLRRAITPKEIDE